MDHKVSFDKIWSAENGYRGRYGDENESRCLFDWKCHWIWMSNVPECIQSWCVAMCSGNKPTRKFSDHSWQRTSFVCIQEHLTSIFTDISNQTKNDSYSHHRISPYIYFQPIKFCRKTLYDPILLDICFNHVPYLLWQYYDHNTVIYQFLFFIYS